MCPAFTVLFTKLFYIQNLLYHVMIGETVITLWHLISGNPDSSISKYTVYSYCISLKYVWHSTKICQNAPVKQQKLLISDVVHRNTSAVML